tara:strand:- start:2755 stop:3009 length:255 start_codon:yes stop_codon:yes gene_type:complete
MICNCGNKIEQGRLDIGLIICLSCAKRAEPSRRKGVMIWNHKTAPEIQIINTDQFNSYRKFNPYGRQTGRGSGLHRVSRSTSSI